MGILCSTVDKDGEGPPKEKIRSQQFFQAPGPRRKLYWGRSVARSRQDHMTSPDMDAYNNALLQLQLDEKARAFDAEPTAAASDLEKTAAEIVRKIKAYDWENTYGKPLNGDGKRTQGEHFLGNVDLINKTELMKIAKKMPKGAHLHIHFNSCLPAKFLIEQARDIRAMYIRSTLPLTSPQNWTKSQISFMVMTAEEACHSKDAAGNPQYVGLGNIFDDSYISNRWMSYKQFQNQFSLTDSVEQELTGTAGAETWLEHKMHISEEEAHGCGQTGRG